MPGTGKMNIENIVKNTIKNTDNAGGGKIDDLLQADILTDDIKEAIFECWKNELNIYIDNYAQSSPDINASKGMYKCSLETWQACASDIGRNYFFKNKYLIDKKKIAAQGGGTIYRDDLLLIGLELYEYYCNLFRKQFFIYDCTRFLGISKEVLYRLNTLHSDLLKRAHTIQESSMRTALASGRSNVTAIAILLNHDYNYTRTTEIIHSSDRIKSADTLPVLKIDDITNNESKRSNENM